MASAEQEYSVPTWSRGEGGWVHSAYPHCTETLGGNIFDQNKVPATLNIFLKKCTTFNLKE